MGFNHITHPSERERAHGGLIHKILSDGSISVSDDGNGNITLSGGSGGSGGGITLSSSVPPAIASSGSVGMSGQAARGDHTHSGVAQLVAGSNVTISGDGTGTVTVSASGGVSLTTNAPADVNGSAVLGSGTAAAKDDHQHRGVHSAVAGTGIGVSGAYGDVTFTNNGVTSLSAGAGISLSGSTGAITVTNAGVTSAVAGNGISISGSTGAVTFTNNIAAGSGISITGTNPLTIASVGTPGYPYTISRGLVLSSTTLYNYDYQYAPIGPAQVNYGSDAINLEFDTTGSSPPSGWSWINQGSATMDMHTNKYSCLEITQPTASNLNFRGIARTIPASSWECAARLWVDTGKNTTGSNVLGSGVYAGAALCLLDGPGGGNNLIAIMSGSVNGGVGLYVSVLNNVSNGTNNLKQQSANSWGDGVYVSFEYDGTNIFCWGNSATHKILLWRTTPGTAYATGPGFTDFSNARIGLFAFQNGTNSTVKTYADWFRKGTFPGNGY